MRYRTTIVPADAEHLTANAEYTFDEELAPARPQRVAALALCLVAACADGPSPGQRHYAECRRQADAQNYLPAIQSCQQALDSEPEHVQARLLLGRLLLKHGQLDIATQHFEYIIQREPRHLEAYEALGDLYVRQRRNNQAIAAYQTVLQHAPNQPALYRKLALVYGDQNRYAEAVEILHKALELEPQHAPTHYNLGLVYQRQARYAEARTQLQQASRLDSTNADAHYRLGQIEAQLGQYSAAEASLRAALTCTNPITPWPLPRSGMSCSNKGVRAQPKPRWCKP